MRFVKLVATYYLDPEVSEVSDAAEVAFTRSIGYSGTAETGGYIPQSQLASLVRNYTPARGRKIAAELVAAELWLVVKGGWQLRTWVKQQAELERLLARRRTDADRQRRHRAAESRQNETEMSRDMNRDVSRDTSRNSLSRVRAHRDLELEEELKDQTLSVEPVGSTDEVASIRVEKTRPSTKRRAGKPSGDDEGLFETTSEPASPAHTQSQILVAAYCDAVNAAGGIHTKAMRGAVGRNIVRLLTDDHIEPAVILVAVQRAGTNRAKDVDRFLGEAQKTFDRAGQARQAMFAAWDEHAHRIDANGATQIGA